MCTNLIYKPIAWCCTMFCRCLKWSGKTFFATVKFCNKKFWEFSHWSWNFMLTKVFLPAWNGMIYVTTKISEAIWWMYENTILLMNWLYDKISTFITEFVIVRSAGRASEASEAVRTPAGPPWDP